MHLFLSVVTPKQNPLQRLKATYNFMYARRSLPEILMIRGNTLSNQSIILMYATRFFVMLLEIPRRYKVEILMIKKSINLLIHI